MKIINMLITLIYGATAAYTTYMAIIQWFVYIANQRMGQEDSFRLPLLYLFGSIVFCVATFVGYKMWIGQTVHIVMKTIFYLPLFTLLLYALWAITIMVSSGGKWN